MPSFREELNRADEITRRNVIKAFAADCLGVTVTDLALADEGQASSPAPTGKKADAVIYIYMSGGMSHLDTFDPKPGTDEQGGMGSSARPTASGLGKACLSWRAFPKSLRLSVP